MALQTNVADVWSIEEVWIRPSVRRVAPDTTFGLDHIVFMGPRACNFLVALEASRVLPGGGFERHAFECVVRVVAIVALQKALIHLVMKRHGEVEFGILVALIAKNWLRSFQQVIGFALMDVVAAETTDITPGMCGTIEIPVLALVTIEAQLVDFLS
jgi:hypothetical protein